MKLFLIALIIFIVSPAKSKNKTPDYLSGCWEKQVKPFKNIYSEMNYSECKHSFYHSFEPWQQMTTKTTGTLIMKQNYFYQDDSLKTAKHSYTSQTQYDPKTLLYIDYGDSVLSKITLHDFTEQPIEIARYSPIFIIDMFYKNKSVLSKASTDSFAVYELKRNLSIMKLFIRKSDSLVTKFTILEDDDLYGDVLSTYHYMDFKSIDKFHYAKSTIIEKMNGKITDTVNIRSVKTRDNSGTNLSEPMGYAMEDEAPAKQDYSIEPYSNHIHFIKMKYTDDKVMIVEFKDFVLMAEAPLNSKNGELIIQEARKIAPGKPIKYFTFCHFHPHYIGGIRAFVHKNVTILSPISDTPYVRYLVLNPHTLNRDSLQIDPRALKLTKIKDSMTITDGSYEMKIYFIGKKSKHTNDYLIYYFPKEKMVFEGDLVWINTKRASKAGPRDKGLYSAIKDLKLDVNTIVQSWPVNNYDVKTVIPFSELEQYVNQKQ